MSTTHQSKPDKETYYSYSLAQVAGTREEVDDDFEDEWWQMCGKLMSLTRMYIRIKGVQMRNSSNVLEDLLWDDALAAVHHKHWHTVWMVLHVTLVLPGGYDNLSLRGLYLQSNDVKVILQACLQQTSASQETSLNMKMLWRFSCSLETDQARGSIMRLCSNSGVKVSM